jgi:hypothetical protein
LAERDCDLPSPLAFPPDDDFPALPVADTKSIHMFTDKHPKTYLFHSKEAIGQKNMLQVGTKIHTMFSRQTALSKRTQ